MDTITVDLEQYVTLLVRAGCTDPRQWPEGLREGAGYLARIREIEAQCKAQHGLWDWELLPDELQTEYDGMCARLDALRRELDPRPNIPASEVFAQLDKKHA